MNSVITAVRESNVHDKMLFSHSVMSDSIATPWTRWSAPGSCVYGISQAGILEWVAVPFSRGSSQPRDRTQVSHSAGGFLISWATREVPWYRSSFLRTFLDKVLSDHTSGPIYNYTTILKTKVELKVCNSQGGGRAYIFFLTEVQLIYNFVIYLALPKVPHPKYTGYMSRMQGNVWHIVNVCKDLLCNECACP